MPTTLIVGASVAGTRVARDLRRLGYDGEVILLDAQLEAPYDRPPLSKSLLTSSDGEAPVLLSIEDAATQAIQLRLGARAVSLDVASSRVQLSDDTEIGYDTLVVATGARARPTPWPRHDRILELRTLADGARLRHALRNSSSVAILGAGFIGSEVSSAARAIGLDVVLIDPVPVPLARLVGTEMGQRLAHLHAANGFDTRFGVGVTRVDGTDAGASVYLTDDTRLEVDVVVAGIGVVPNQEWLLGSGLPVDNGVQCDSSCRVAGNETIFAAGDVARWFHPRHGRLVRVEHWTNAVEQAQCVARQIARPTQPEQFAPVEYVWSDQYDWKIQIVGRPDLGSSVEVVNDPQRARFCAVYADPSGDLAGLMSVNWPKATVLARRGLQDSRPAQSLATDITRLLAA